MRGSNGGKGKVNGARIKYSCVHGRKEGRPRRNGGKEIDARRKGTDRKEVPWWGLAGDFVRGRPRGQRTVFERLIRFYGPPRVTTEIV